MMSKEQTNKPIRVLHILGSLGSGGAESFIMNVYRKIDRSHVQFDFLVRSQDNGPMLDEVKRLGGQVFIQPPFPTRILQNYAALRRFLREHAADYAAIHVHANALIYTKPLQLAKRYGISARIIHCHSTHSVFVLLHRFNKNRVDKWVTARFACSDLAGEWMFPQKEYRVIPNGIDLERFSYNEAERSRIREQYGLENKVVIGNVGRLTAPKNHGRILEIFEAYHRENPNSALLLVGDGEERENIRSLAAQKKLSDCVIFTGAVTDVENYLSAMDVFLFPSLWEGLGIVLIEAQTNGLPCLISDAVPQMANCGNCHALSLRADDSEWVREMTRLISQGRCTAPTTERFDSRAVAGDLERFYLESTKQRGA